MFRLEHRNSPVYGQGVTLPVTLPAGEPRMNPDGHELLVYVLYEKVYSKTNDYKYKK